MTSKQKAILERMRSRGKGYMPIMGSKGRALEAFRAKIHKKKTPEPITHEKPKSDYKRLSIEEYEKKYA